jgi:hypothetical protein
MLVIRLSPLILGLNAGISISQPPSDSQVAVEPRDIPASLEIMQHVVAVAHRGAAGTRLSATPW